MLFTVFSFSPSLSFSVSNLFPVPALFSCLHARCRRVQGCWFNCYIFWVSVSLMFSFLLIIYSSSQYSKLRTYVSSSLYLKWRTTIEAKHLYYLIYQKKKAYVAIFTPKNKKINIYYLVMYNFFYLVSIWAEPPEIH